MDQYLDLANDGPYGYGPDVLYQANDVIMQYAKGKTYLSLPVQQAVPAMSRFEARGRHMRRPWTATSLLRCPGQCAGADAVLSGGSAAED